MSNLKNSTIYQSSESDRNFDEIADHFAKKVYGGLKGNIRLAVLQRDIFTWINQQRKPLRILDIGAGLAQLSIELAKMGHQVTVNDISTNMLNKAQENAKEIGKKITWHCCPYQQLSDKLSGKYDLILCHAVLEWLENPEHIMNFFDNWLTDTGTISLCFYNPASFIYRNLIMGNFNLLNKTNFTADNGSLTPNNPVSKEVVFQWLNTHHYHILTISGLRVFHDYSPLKRGGHTNPQAVINMELKYSNQEPYQWLGRYLHIMAQRLIR